jgi:hypothetical protein
MIALPYLLLERPDRLSFSCDGYERALACPGRVADKATFRKGSADEYRRVVGRSLSRAAVRVGIL